MHPETSTIAAGNISTKPNNHIADPNTMRHCGRGSGYNQYHLRRPAEPICRALRCRWPAANAGLDFRIYPHLRKVFSRDAGLAELFNRSPNLPLITCMYAEKFQRRLTLLCLISISAVKHDPALLAKKFQRRPPNVLHVFGRAPSDLQLCFVQLKTLAHLPDIRLLSIP